MVEKIENLLSDEIKEKCTFGVDLGGRPYVLYNDNQIGVCRDLKSIAYAYIYSGKYRIKKNRPELFERILKVFSQNNSITNAAIDIIEKERDERLEKVSNE